MSGQPAMAAWRRWRYRLGRGLRQNARRLLRALTRDGLTIASVIHCGAHLGQERGDYEALGAKAVLWIEGSPATFARLAESLQADGRLAADHRAVNALLFAEEGRELVLHGFSNDGESNSVFHATEAFTDRWPGIGETGSGEPLLTSTLDRVAADRMPAGADLLVLDLQGAELEVLKGGAATLDGAKAVICEVSKVPIYEGGALHDDVVAHLDKAGFIAMHRAHTCGDLLFLRKGLV